jgi:hypothetical protein
VILPADILVEDLVSPRGDNLPLGFLNQIRIQQSSPLRSRGRSVNCGIDGAPRWIALRSDLQR